MISAQRFTILNWLQAQLDVDQAEAETDRDRAEVEAKRAILELYVDAADRTRPAHGAATLHEARAGALADALQHIAEIYADRPGYDEAWRPEPPPR